MRKCIAWLALAGGMPIAAAGQTVINGSRRVAGAWDAGTAAATRPAKTGTELPATCLPGAQFFKIDAVPGQNLYLCTASDTWTQLAAGGGGGGGDVFSEASASVDSEIVLFSGTSGKLIKRAAGSGVAKIADGVLGTVAGAAGDCVRVDGTSGPCAQASPLTTKGDLYGYAAGETRVPAGANGTVLAADSTAAAGVSYKTVKMTVEDVLWFAGSSASSTAYPTGGVAIPGTNGAGLSIQMNDPYRLPVAAFPKGSADLTINVSTRIRSNYDGGAMTLAMPRLSGTGSPATVRWEARAACTADGGVLANPVWPAGWSVITDAIDGNNHFKTVSFGDLQRAGCAAGTPMTIQLRRANTHADDSWAGNMYVPYLILTYKALATLE